MTASTKKQIVVAASFMGALIVVLGLVKFIQISRAMAQGGFSPPPEAITSVVAKEETWARNYRAVGSIAPVQGATLAAEEAGRVAKINFESGAKVNAGDVLVELDTGVEEANLKVSEAKRDWAQKKLARAQKLRSSNAVSQDALDDAESEYHQASASVDSLRATITRKRAVAPFAGRAGIRLVNVGQYVAQGAELVSLQTVDPVYVNFTIPQQILSSVAAGQDLSVSIDAFPGIAFAGKITSIDSKVEEATRNVMAQGTIPNPDEKLKPGMFAQVQVIFSQTDVVIPLPATAVNYAPYGDTVYVIEKMKDPTGKEYVGVRNQIVKLGEQRGDQVAVLSGVKPGEEVATSGLFKLRPGAAVMVNNKFAPENSPDPKPADT